MEWGSQVLKISREPSYLGTQTIIFWKNESSVKDRFLSKEAQKVAENVLVDRLG